LFTSCSSVEDSSFTVEYFNKGEVILLDKYQEDDFAFNINGIIRATDERIQLIVTKDLITQLKEENECIEISFSKLLKVRSKKLGILRVEKLLVPLSGKYIGDELSPSGIVFIADEKGYVTGPLGCKNCLKYIKAIKKSIQ